MRTSWIIAGPGFAVFCDKWDGDPFESMYDGGEGDVRLMEMEHDAACERQMEADAESTLLMDAPWVDEPMDPLQIEQMQ